MGAEVIRVLLVDDNALFLEGLKNMLEDNGIQVLGMAARAATAVDRATLLRPDVVLMDVLMPQQSGIEATRRLKSLFPEMKIVMMTASESDDHLFDAMAAGASGYLRKGASPESFVEALEGLARGETPLSPGLAGKIMAEFARRERERNGDSANQAARETGFARLSERQTEILRQVAAGTPYKEIAAQLGLSVATIKYHMGEIADRLYLGNRAQVIAYAGRMNKKDKTVR